MKRRDAARLALAWMTLLAPACTLASLAMGVWLVWLWCSSVATIPVLLSLTLVMALVACVAFFCAGVALCRDVWRGWRTW